MSAEDQLLVETSKGKVVIDMRPDLAPVHCARIKELVRQGYYDGVVFHRVIEGFMAQTGDPTGTGSGGTGKKMKAEFTDEKFERGVCGMARTGHPDTGDSQWFIMFAPAPHLNGQYTVWGKVSEGMEVVDSLKKGSRNGAVSDPDKIVTLRVAADVAA